MYCSPGLLSPCIQDSFWIAITAMAPRFAEQKLQPDSNILPVMKKKPRLHDTDKNRLVQIPPSSFEPPDVGLTRIHKLLNATIIIK